MRAAQQPAQVVSEDNGDFFVSLLIAEATDSWMLGTLAGGNIVGAIIGQEIADSNKESTSTDTCSQVVEQRVEQVVETPSEPAESPSYDDSGSSCAGSE